MTASIGSDSRQAGVSTGTVISLVGPVESLLLSAQGEAGKREAAASEAGLIRGLTTTVAEEGRMVGACAMVARAGPRD